MLKGTLDDFTLADIFKLLSFSKKTGRVELTRKAGMGRVFFRDGEVYFAESSLSREPLGQKLIRARALTDSHLRRALDEHADTGERVGQILLRENWVTEEQLEDAVKQQIEDAVFDLLRWDLGDFDWEPNVTWEPEIPISVSVENLIMESSRRLDELETISRKVPSSHAVVAVAPAPPEGAVEINITPDEWRVLVLVDGHRTVETIANTIGLDEFQTMKIVHGMVSAGLVEVVGEDSDQAVIASPPPPPSVESASSAPSVEAQAESVVPAEPAAPVESEFQTDTEPEGHAEAEPVVQEVASESPDVFVSDEPLAVNDSPTEIDDFFAAETNGESLGFEGGDAFTSPDTEAQDIPAPTASAGEQDFPEGADLLEETLFEAKSPEDELPTMEADPAPAGDLTADPGSPPEEWFTDPDLSMELFDRPAPGDMLTELPATNGSNGTNGTAVHDAPAEEVSMLDFSQLDAATDDAMTTEETVEEAPTAQSAPPAAPRTPPPPPVAPIVGPERTRAVRELSDLFEENPVERPKRPVLRRIETPDPAAKRRVEDDEQVTKSLISRLIEGVKGL